MSQYGAQFLGPERWQASDTFVPIADGSADLLDPATGDFDPRPCPRFGDAELRAQCEARVRASCGLEPPVPCQWDQAKMVIAALQARGDARVRPGVLVEQGLLEPSRAAEGGGSLGPVLGYMLPAGSQVARRTRGGGGRVKLVALLITAVVIGAHYLSDTSAPNPPGGDDDDRRRCPPITPSSSTGWAIGETVPVTVCADDLGVHTSVVGVRYRSDGGEGATSLLFSNVGVKPVLAGAVSLQPGFQTPVTIQVTSREQLLSLTSPGSAPASISYRTGGGLFDR